MPKATIDNSSFPLALLSKWAEERMREDKRTSSEILAQTVRLIEEEEILRKLQSAVTALRARRQSEAKAKRLPPNVIDFCAWKEKRA